jgi:hypothetical protein
MNRACPVCGAEYLDWVAKCADCGVALVAPADLPDPLQLPEEQQVVYELGAWPLELQAAAAEAMADSSIPHGWDGLDLVVHLDHEAAVDAIMAKVEEEHGEAAAADDAELTYELDEWPEHDREAVTSKLAEGGVPYRWEDESTLVVASRDEQRVEEILDEVEFPDALPRFDDVAGAEGDDGEGIGDAGADDGEPDDDDTTEAVDADPEMMGNLFVAADRLIKNPLDPTGVESLSHILGEIDPDVPPYGVAPALWHKVVDGAEAMGDALAEEGDTRLHEVSQHATMVRDLLRPYV